MLVQDGIQKKKRVKKKRVTKTKHPKIKYTCERCKDSGVVLCGSSNKQIKCHCIVKLEINNWLDCRLKVIARRYSTTVLSNLNISKTDEPYLFKLYKGVKTDLYLKQILKHLVEQYFKKNMNTYSYELMTGNDYTEKYVVGEHHIYHKVDELFIILGLDNYNQTLKTTIYSLITERKLKDKLTWILIPDLKVATGSLTDLYGQLMVSYLKDPKNFDKILTGAKK